MSDTPGASEVPVVVPPPLPEDIPVAPPVTYTVTVPIQADPSNVHKIIPGTQIMISAPNEGNIAFKNS